MHRSINHTSVIWLIHFDALNQYAERMKRKTVFRINTKAIIYISALYAYRHSCLAHEQHDSDDLSIIARRSCARA